MLSGFIILVGTKNPRDVLRGFLFGQYQNDSSSGSCPDSHLTTLV